MIDCEVVEDPAVVAAVKASVALLRAEVDRRLALTSRKDAYIYVHGYHSTFEDAAFALAELWRFLAQKGLPMIYTWPAGYPGVFG